MFYDDSILSGTKTDDVTIKLDYGFMMTQFFQVLKPIGSADVHIKSFMMTQFFQVLKRLYKKNVPSRGFMMTQFFQVLKHQIPLFT